MTSLPGSSSKVIGTQSHLCFNLQSTNAQDCQLKDFWLRKSVFNPAPELAEEMAARRHFAGVDVPRIQILYYSSRWLLLQTPQAKTNFFQNLNKGKLGNREEQLLKLFKSFVALVKYFGFFHTSQKMIFMYRTDVRVWINEDIFSNRPMRPIIQGNESQNHFVRSFIAMIETSLQEWESLSNVVTIDQTIRALQWRCKLARGSLTAINASQYANYKPQESQISLNQSQLGNPKNIISSQQLENQRRMDQFKIDLINSCTLIEHSLFNKKEDLGFVKKNVEFQITQAEEFGLTNHTKKKFTPHSTSSTLGNFSEKFRSTVGRKKLLEKAQSLEQQAALKVPPLLLMQTQFQDLFADEENELAQEYDQQELQRIAEQMQQVLIW